MGNIITGYLAAAAVSLLALILPSACGPGSAAVPPPANSAGNPPVPDQGQPVDAGEGTGVTALLDTSLASPARLASAQQYPASADGSGYLPEAGAGNCSASGTSAMLSPGWVDAQQSGISDVAYCVYGLGLDPLLDSATLTLGWDGSAPSGGLGWLGLGGGDSWDWQQLYSASIALSNAQQYANADGNVYIAIVVLGTAQRTLASIALSDGGGGGGLTYPIIDTMQNTSHDDTGALITPSAGQPFHGQDAQYSGNQASYSDNGDGTITDNVTGLMWAQVPNNMEKCTFEEAFVIADNLVLGGYDDWRVPTIKELYSLIDFRGVTGMTELESVPYINTAYFDFEYGDESAGERIIDAQYWSSTEYVSTTMGGSATTFGVNFADGRIKGYGRENPLSGSMEQFIRCVRGRTDYGTNSFVDNGNGTISDNATGLMWMEFDSGHFNIGDESDGLVNWEQALTWAENLEYSGYSDWRLPNAKELQSIVDYTRSPATINSPALDPIFDSTSILDEEGSVDWAHYWTNTSHFDGMLERLGDRGCYIAFGEGQGYMEMPPDSGSYVFWDVHGAGCQRSDPKSGDPADYPYGHGPQGDVIRIYNLVRCVRGSGLAE